MLVGGAGNDNLTGGTGLDRFKFNSRTEGLDRIIDFVVADDTIEVSATGFAGGLTANATITTAQLVIGTAATTINHRFIYNSTNGALFFDQDGSGVTAALQIATLGTGLALTNADFFVV
jgi:Ca2+-binding RTX toxin-like protein